MANYKGRILVVEDSDEIRELLEIVLSAEDFDVRSAKDGVEALKLAEQWSPGLITLDLDIPKKDGWSLIRDLRRGDDTNSISILVISAYTSELGRSLRILVDGVISKPFYITQVVNEVTEIFEKRRRS